MTQKQTLVTKGEDELVIKVEAKMTKPSAMDMPASEMKVPAKSPAGSGTPAVQPKELRKGEETLEIAGKKLACQWVEMEVETGGKMKTKSWMSDEVPGRVVKVETKGDNLESTMVLTGFEAKK